MLTTTDATSIRKMLQTIIAKSLKLPGSFLNTMKESRGEGDGETTVAKGGEVVIPEVSSHNYVLIGDPFAEGGFSEVFLARKKKKRVNLQNALRAKWRRKSDGVAVIGEQAERYAIKICELSAENTQTDPEVLSLYTLREQEEIMENERNVTSLNALEDEVSFLRELRRSNHVVKLVDAFVFKPKEQAWLVMEHMVIDLYSVEKQKLMSTPDGWMARRIILKRIADALVYLKEKRIIHADLKPSNILMSRMGAVKLCDFGIAKRLPEGQEHFVSKNEKGSTEFMAPEIIKDGNRYDFGIDVWAFGMVAVTLHKAGKTLYPKKSPRVSSRFTDGYWRMWAGNPVHYFFSLFGSHLCSPEEHDIRWQIYMNGSELTRKRMDTEKVRKEWAEDRAADAVTFKKHFDYAMLLRMCLVPNADSCPTAITIQHDSEWKRRTIEEVLQSNYFSALKYTELQERNLVIGVIRNAVVKDVERITL